MRGIFAGFVAFFATAPFLARAADLTSYTSKEGKDIIILRGDIARWRHRKTSQSNKRR